MSYMKLTSSTTIKRNKYWIIFATTITLGIAMIMLSPDTDTADTTARVETGEQISASSTIVNLIIASDHVPGNVLSIDQVDAAQGAFVVIHEDTPEGKPGQILGVSTLVDIGTSKEVVVELSREVIDGERVYAMMHTDNGDGVYDPTQDHPTNSGEDSLVVTGFQIDASANGEQIDI